MARKLTDRYLASLKGRQADYFEWDTTTGLGIKVTPAGRKMFVVQLKFPGTKVQSKRAIGQYDPPHGMTLAKARAIAHDWWEKVRQGVDPKEEAERQAKQQCLAEQVEAATTFGAAAETYMAGRKDKRRRVLDEREIRRSLIPAWGELPIASITTTQVRRHLQALIARAPWEARNAWGHAYSIFKWAAFNELIPTSPMFLLDKEMLFANAGIKPRTRHLSDAEVVALWHATANMVYPEKHFYRWLLMTGCRLDEAAGARWEELHDEVRRVIRRHRTQGIAIEWAGIPPEHKTWTVPEERFKQGVEHVVPLTNAMCGLLALMPHNSEWLFSYRGTHAIDPGSKLKAKVDARMLHCLQELARRRGDDVPTVLKNWTNHDLRRTVRTTVAALGFPKEVAERVLGHDTEDPIERTYNRYKYEREVRAALEAWNHRLAQLIGRNEI